MDESALKFAERLVPPSYVSQGGEAMRARRSKVRQLLEQVIDLIQQLRRKFSAAELIYC